MSQQEPIRAEEGTPKKEPARKSLAGFAGPLILAALFSAGLFAVVRDGSCPLAVGQENPAPTEGASMTVIPSQKQPSAREKAARATVEKLVNEQKFEAAAAECARLRAEARKSGDIVLWTWSLIKEGQLRSALHGYETAVRFFKEEAWPDAPLERDMLELFYGKSLVDYYRS